MSDCESIGTEESISNLERAREEFKKSNLSKNFTLCNLVAIAVIGVVPSLYDVFSDFNLGVAYISDGNYTWGVLTLLLTIAPGLHWSTYKTLVIGDNPSCCLATLFMLSCLAFPVFLVMFKLGMLINHGRGMKFLGIWLTGCEMGYESIPQLCLQLYIIFKRPLHEASRLQLTALATSLFTAAIGPAEWFLWTKQTQAVDRYEAEQQYEDLGFKDKLPMLAKHLLFYALLVIFRVLSFSVVVSVFQVYSVVIYIVLFLFLFFLGGCKVANKYPFSSPFHYWIDQSRNRPFFFPAMIFTSMFTTAEDYYQPEHQFLWFWLVANICLVSIATPISFLLPEVFLNDQHVFVQTPLVLAIIAVAILFSGITSIILFYKLGVRKVLDAELVPVTEKVIHLEPGTRMIAT